MYPTSIPPEAVLEQLMAQITDLTLQLAVARARNTQLEQILQMAQTEETPTEPEPEPDAPRIPPHEQPAPDDEPDEVPDQAGELVGV